jgi:hypothetical protein
MCGDPEPYGTKTTFVFKVGYLKVNLGQRAVHLLWENFCPWRLMALFCQLTKRKKKEY